MTEPGQTPTPRSPSAAIRSVRRRWIAACLVILVAIGAAGAWKIRQGDLARRLLATPVKSVAAHPDLVRFATSEARPLFAHDCAACHGPDMKGNTSIGAPDLTDQVWVYGNGSVFDIERTILYGIRSGQKQGHDVTEMPAFGQRGMLSSTQIDDVVQYLLALSRRPHDPGAAERGHAVFTGPASCNDCHSFDARGDAYYGAPDLTANTWMYGGDVQSLKDSIYFGRHGVMPGWRGKLTLQQIRALAVFIYGKSHPKAH